MNEKRMFSKRRDAGLLFALRLAGGSENVPRGVCAFLLYWKNGSKCALDFKVFCNPGKTSLYPNVSLLKKKTK